jgi:hypothetical protein
MFYGTLIYFLRLHPEINWVEEIEPMIHPETSDNGLRLLHQAMKETVARHQALKGMIQPLGESGDRIQGEALKNEVPRCELTGIRLERFEKIDSKINWR